MSNESPSDVLRKDENLRIASERLIDQFKYLAGVSWAPVVVVMAFFRGGDAEFGWLARVVLSGSVVGLMIAGSLFFLANQKQSVAFVHVVMGEKALEMAYTANPSAKAIVDTNKLVAQRLGHMADSIAFPLLTISYGAISFVALFAVWS